MTRRVRIASALAAVGVAIALTADPVAAGGTAPTIKVAEHKDGPYHDSLAPISVPKGTAEVLYFKLKNETGSTVAANIYGSPGIEPEYKHKWFRGTKNITDKLTDVEGIDVTLQDGAVKRYRVKIKHRDVPGSATGCLAFRADGMFPLELLLVGINGPCT